MAIGMRHLSHWFRSHSLEIERKVVLDLRIPFEYKGEKENAVGNESK